MMLDNNLVKLTFDSWCSLSDGKISIQVPTHYACVFNYQYCRPIVVLKNSYTPYSKMAANKLFFCLHVI